MIEKIEACRIPARESHHAPADDALAQLLAATQTVAIVGMSPKADRTSYGVAEWLMNNTHFELYFVNPVAVGEEALGQPFYASLADLPVAPHMVDVFRRAELVGPVVDEAIAAGASTLWLQLGIVNEAEAARATEAGLDVIQNRCLKVEYRRLSGAIESVVR